VGTGEQLIEWLAATEDECLAKGRGNTMSTITRTMSNNRNMIVIGGLVLLGGIVVLIALPLDRTAVPVQLPAVSGAQAESKSVVRNAEELSAFTQAREGAVSAIDAPNLGIDVGQAVNYLTFTQEREGVMPAIDASDAARNAEELSTFTRAREATGPGLNIDAAMGIMPWNLTFTQAREQWYGLNIVSQPLFTIEREASSHAPLITSSDVPLFTQAREQWYGVKVSSQPLFTEAREVSGYAPSIATPDVPLFTQAREQGYGAKIVGSPLFTQAREG
jgi:hypothetical protein